jgi:hypothetical protein
MAKYKEIYGSKAGAILIEVDDYGSESSSIEIRQLLDALQGIADIGGEGMESLPKENRPAELELSFGIKALSNGQVAICMDETDANIKVKLKWSKSAGPAEMVQDIKQSNQ